MKYFYYEPYPDRDRWVVAGMYDTKKAFEGEDCFEIVDGDDCIVLYLQGKSWQLDPEEDLRCVKEKITIEETLDLFYKKRWPEYNVKEVQASFLEGIKDKNAFVLDVERSMETDSIIYLQVIPIVK